MLCAGLGCVEAPPDMPSSCSSCGSRSPQCSPAACSCCSTSGIRPAPTSLCGHVVAALLSTVPLPPGPLGCPTSPGVLSVLGTRVVPAASVTCRSAAACAPPAALVAAAGCSPACGPCPVITGTLPGPRVMDWLWLMLAVLLLAIWCVTWPWLLPATPCCCCRCCCAGGAHVRAASCSCACCLTLVSMVAAWPSTASSSSTGSTGGARAAAACCCACCSLAC
mmetsp:Transcript_30320/g.77339  ORF Transcript_30320/g.77339 Transcript_30320/m.77339 type:complete len:222 (+) Transcript_30320:921-1586(+)